MVNETSIGLELVQPIPEHAQLIMNWRNDPITLKMSYHTKPKRWEKFYREFLENYFKNPLLPPLFGTFRGARIGFVRFRVMEHPLNSQEPCCEISININPDHRNRGFGTSLLQKIIHWLPTRWEYDIYAEILEENTTSRRIFLKAGFEEVGKGEKYIDEERKFLAIRKYLKKNKLKQEESVFIIAEAGSNWKRETATQDLDAAKQLIQTASESGANAIKFQVFKPETVYVANAGEFEYLNKAGIKKDILKVFEHLSMPAEFIPVLAAFCKECGIEFMASCFSLLDFDLIDPYVKRHKIASYELNHIRLIEKAAQSLKPLYLSTGGSNLDEVDWAVETFQKYGGKELTLLQCTAQYPAEEKYLNLQAISFLKEHFKVEVGFSDHSQDPMTAPIAAVALGAKVVEKHFTLDRTLPGPDHIFAIQPEELKKMVLAIRKVEQMLGTNFKSVQEGERELRNHARRGLQAIKNIAIGEKFEENHNYAILRPGQQTLGIHSKYLYDLEGNLAKREILMGDGIQLTDW